MTDTERARAWLVNGVWVPDSPGFSERAQSLAAEFAAVREECAQVLDGLSENAEERSARVYRDAAAAIRELGDG